MPNEHEIHKETYDKAVAEVESFLQEKFPNDFLVLSDEELKGYFPPMLFTHGWVIGDSDLNIFFKILLPSQFPYAVPRIAIEDATDPTRNFGNEWPHVEGQGVLCLPTLNPSVEHPAELVNALLHHAIRFVTDFRSNKALVETDFRKEFISYWGRRTKEGDAKIWSLLDPESETQEVFIGHAGRGGYFVSPSEEQAISWFRNRHTTDQKPSTVRGLYIKLAQAPIPPFPSSIIEMEEFIKTHAPDSLTSFQSYLLKIDPYVIIFSAPGESGRGMIAVSSTINPNAPNPERGFRSVRTMPANVRLSRMSGSSYFKRHQVARSDHDWIHGRGKDESQETLRSSSVAVLGCGSLGSHVAVRLAQAGVGKILLSDFDDMETANVGRHVLGIRDVGTKKTSSLAKELRERFPHLKILELPFPWEAILKNKPEVFDCLSLIISTMGEWKSEGPLNEWSIKEKKFPVLYGWMEPRAAVAHALLIKKEGGCLQCVVDGNGEMYEPDSSGWPREHGLESEPACGSVFQPYGPVDLAYAEALVADLAIGTLLGREKENAHHIHATSTDHLTTLGGTWTDIHKKFRPKDFSGSFQYKKDLTVNTQCRFCTKKK